MRGPLFSAVPWPSLSAVHLASIGISAALYVREVTGRGQWVTTSLLQGALINGTFTWQRAQRPERRGYRMWVTDPRVPHGFFRTADGDWIHHWTPQPGFVLTVAGGDRLEPTIDGRVLKTDGSRVGMDPEELVVLRETAPAMEAAFARFSTEPGSTRRQGRACPSSRFGRPRMRCSTRCSWPTGVWSRSRTRRLADPPGRPDLSPPCHAEHHTGSGPEGGTAHRGVLGERDEPIPVRGCRWAGPVPPSARQRHHPGIAASAAAVVAAGGCGRDRPRSGHRRPFGAQMLADLGAEVIKVNRLSDQAWMDTYMGMCCNRGKRSIAVELKSPGGWRSSGHWLSGPTSCTPTCGMTRPRSSGSTTRACGEVNPRIIYCHTRGFENGPRMLLPGHDQSASALAGRGMGGRWRRGRREAHLAQPLPRRHRQRHAVGHRRPASALASPTHGRRTVCRHLDHVCAPPEHLVGVDPRRPTNRPHRPRLDALTYGLTALYRLYETNDGWMCLAVVTDDQWHRLCAASASRRRGMTLASTPRRPA